MEKLAELKARIADVATDVFAIDWYLMHWLRFENMDLSKAEATIRTSANVRQKYLFAKEQPNADTVEAVSKVAFLSSSLATDGFSSVFILQSGKFLPKSLAKKYGKETVCYFYLQFYYQVEKDYIQSVEMGYDTFEEKANLASNFLFINNLAGIGVWEYIHPTGFDVSISSSKMSIECFPIFVSNICVINVSKGTKFLAKPFKLLVKKLILFEESDMAWKKIVCKHIDPELVIGHYAAKN